MWQRRSDIGDRKVWIMVEEFSDAPRRLFLSTGQRIGRRSEPICPDRRWMLGDAARKPARCLVVASGLEVRRGNSD